MRGKGEDLWDNFQSSHNKENNKYRGLPSGKPPFPAAPMPVSQVCSTPALNSDPLAAFFGGSINTGHTRWMVRLGLSLDGAEKIVEEFGSDKGELTVIRSRWQSYVQTFCDTFNRCP